MTARSPLWIPYKGYVFIEVAVLIRAIVVGPGLEFTDNCPLSLHMSMPSCRNFLMAIAKRTLFLNPESTEGSGPLLPLPRRIRIDFRFSFFAFPISDLRFGYRVNMTFGKSWEYVQYTGFRSHTTIRGLGVKF
ncbi:hypothetical protein PILCRDRAFT_656102 [Piloderma croceum F 1598]|uniref:Uncharacterized protein n=1 Tax=Piloderma croceum (strain F 1598) TaxID=765440 RepID=A0A0C3BFQ7_PILCF|nr:hypothetical protein PILCRDRAFT_656102 [Piloderma croceum F 1598]